MDVEMDFAIKVCFGSGGVLAAGGGGRGGCGASGSVAEPGGSMPRGGTVGAAVAGGIACGVCGWSRGGTTASAGTSDKFVCGETLATLSKPSAAGLGDAVVGSSGGRVASGSALGGGGAICEVVPGGGGGGKGSFGGGGTCGAGGGGGGRAGGSSVNDKAGGEGNFLKSHQVSCTSQLDSASSLFRACEVKLAAQTDPANRQERHASWRSLGEVRFPSGKLVGLLRPRRATLRKCCNKAWDSEDCTRDFRLDFSTIGFFFGFLPAGQHVTAACNSARAWRSFSNLTSTTIPSATLALLVFGTALTLARALAIPLAAFASSRLSTDCQIFQIFGEANEARNATAEKGRTPAFLARLDLAGLDALALERGTAVERLPISLELSLSPWRWETERHPPPAPLAMLAQRQLTCNCALAGSGAFS